MQEWVLMSIFESDGFVPGVDPEILATQIGDDLETALGDPLGPERLHRLEELASLAHKHGLDETEITVRLELVWDALESGDTEYALATLSWVLQQVAHGQMVPTETQNQVIAQQLLQIPTLAARHPGVSAKLIEHLTFWMEYFTAQAGISLRSRWITRHQVELGRGHREAAREALEIISALEEIPREVRDEADCPLHHYRSRIAWAVNSSEFAQALSLYRDALERSAEADWQCIQPDDLNPLLMLPLSWAGEGDAAWRAHERSYRHQTETSQYLGDIASHLRFCAATWNIPEGLELLETHAQWFSNPEDPWDLLVATRSAATFLSRAVGAFIGTGTKVPPLGFAINGSNRWLPFESLSPADTLSLAQARLESVAMKLALAFDSRNANNTMSTRVIQSLHEAPLCSFASVKDLLSARFGVKNLLAEQGLSETSPEWVLPDLNDPSWLRQPVPEFRLLDVQQGAEVEKQLRTFEDSVDFSALPAAISADKERLVLGANRVTFLAAAGKWNEVIDTGELLLEIGERLDDHRQSLRLACYLVQAYWQLDDLSAARNWLVRADEFVDATISDKPRALLDDLSLLAG